jgi:hypothetical protein
MLKIFNSMGISTTHIKELKTMLKGAPMIKEEGVYIAALPFNICEFFVTVAIISLSNKSTIWSPNWFWSNLVTLEWNSLLLIIASNSFLSFLNSSMKTISQTLIMSWLGKNYQWAMVEGSSGLSALGEGGILKGIKLYSKIMQNPVLKKEFDAIINKREFHSNVTENSFLLCHKFQLPVNGRS